MKNILFIMAWLLCALATTAHNVDLTPLKLRNWKLNNGEVINGSFLMLKGDAIFIEKNDGSVVHFPLTSFTKDDAQFAMQKYASIKALNNYTPKAPVNHYTFNFWKLITVAVLLLIIICMLFLFAGKRRIQYIAYFLAVGMLSTVYGFRKATLAQLSSTTSPSFVDSAFAPFKPNVATYYDADYFYVESKGIPITHEMMVGISNHGWQQQVPVPQCYFNPNAWPIPLNPVMASSPIPCDSVHFTRGAIAIAANGVPIFNVHTNTGVDSYLDGQLDDFGGHCGRADDYHYHIAPLHLYGYTSTALPIAFGLDGFAVYGSVEPDGSPMQALDANHGHFGADGVYHYHGTASAPYMIARMAGQVTEDNTHQLVPQAAAHPIRPPRTPLSGALITSCVAHANNNGYTLTFTNSGQTYQIDYGWDSTGNYTFHYINPNGTLDSVYHGFVQCDLPSGLSTLEEQHYSLVIFPNPASNQFSIQLDNNIKPGDVKNISLIAANGTQVYSVNGYQQEINTAKFSTGIYYVTVKTNKGTAVKKLVIQ